MRCTFNGYCLFHIWMSRKSGPGGTDVHIGIIEKTSVGRLLIFLVPGKVGYLKNFWCHLPFCFQCVPNSTLLNSICFGKCCPPFSCIPEPNEKTQHGPNVFFGFVGSDGEARIFHFPLVPNVFLVSSHWVLIMFPMIFHDVLNIFFKFPLYSLTHSQEHLTFIPYGLANVVLLSFIYIIKLGSFFCFVTLRSLKLSCFGLHSWYLWEAIDESCIGLVS